MACWLAGVLAVANAAQAPTGAAPRPLHGDLVGAWRLIRIKVTGPSGEVIDPFYQRDSVGLLIYHPSGAMSVQIAAPHRASFEIPAARSGVATGSTPDERLKAAAVDTYYAYFGTWTLDEATSVVTHRVTASLLPAETGRHYEQHVALEGALLTFTSGDTIEGHPVTRTKVWRRIAEDEVK